MRPTSCSIVCVALFGAAVLAAGCDSSEAKPSAGVLMAEGAQRQLNKVARQTKDYAYAVRDEFVKDMKNDLAAINGMVQTLEAKAESARDAAKAKAKLAALRDRVAELNRELEKANNAPETAWDEVKAGFKRSHEDLRQSVAQTRTWLSEMIAP